MKILTLDDLNFTYFVDKMKRQVQSFFASHLRYNKMSKSGSESNGICEFSFLFFFLIEKKRFGNWSHHLLFVCVLVMCTLRF